MHERVGSVCIRCGKVVGARNPPDTRTTHASTMDVLRHIGAGGLGTNHYDYGLRGDATAMYMQSATTTKIVATRTRCTICSMLQQCHYVGTAAPVLYTYLSGGRRAGHDQHHCQNDTVNYFFIAHTGRRSL